jgi:hypothetical protein
VRTGLVRGALVLLAAAGCARDGGEVAGGPARAGDVVRPRPHVPEPWTAGTKTAFGAFVEVARPGRPEPYDLRDEDVPEGSVRVVGTVTFFAGDAPLGEPAALAFAHEC